MAGSGSNKLNMTKRRRGLLLIFILWGYLRKATARQVVAQVNKVGRQKKAWSSSYLYSMGLPEKSACAAGSGSNELNMTTKKAWSSSYCYSMGLPEKSAGAAGSGSDGLSMTTEKSVAFFLSLFYLRKAPAWQVVTDQVQMDADLGSTSVIH